MKIIDGKKHAKLLKEKLIDEVNSLKKEGIIPKLAVVLVGSDPASKAYVRMMEKMATKIGISFDKHILDETINQIKLESEIKRLNNDSTVSGIIVQMPLPKGFDQDKIISMISPGKDVDGANPVNVGKLVTGKDTFVPCTPAAVMELLKMENIELEGKDVAVIGRSNVVGKPVASLLLNENATPTICHSRTRNLKAITKNVDLVVAAVGVPYFIKHDMVKENVIVIDVGINKVDSGYVGDVDFDNVSKKASYITPVPGGVGPMTIVKLMENTIKASKK